MTWERIKVGDLGRVVTGKTPKTAEKDNYNGNIMFVTPSDDMDAKYIYSTGKTITKKGMQSVKGAIIPAGAICVSCIGSDLGKVVITTEECVTNQQINSIIIDASRFDTDFIYYSMLILGKELNFHSKTSTAVPIVNKSSFSSYEIKCPPLEEQKKIAGVLSTIDEKRERNERINDNLSKQSKELFNEYYHSTEIPKLTLSSIATIKYGKGLPTKNLLPKGYPVFGGNGIIGCFNKYLYDEPQILVSCRGAASGNILISYPQSFVTNNSLVLELNDYRYFHFIKQYLLENPLYSYATGSAQPQITIDNIKDVPIPYPEYHDISGLVAQLANISSFCYQNTCENNTLASIRDALLPKLMSGELDVSRLDL